MRKVRCRVVDKASGEPIGGVVVHLALRLGDSHSHIHLPVTALRSDAIGYVSFDLQPLIDAGVDTAGGLLVSAPQLRLKDKDLLGALLGDGDGSSGTTGSGSSSTRAAVLLHSSDDVVPDDA